MTVTELDLALENEFIKRQIASYGVDAQVIWSPKPGHPEQENRELSQVLAWVRAWHACPDRKRLKARGFQYPPVEPAVDPESDWVRFERWARGLAVTWSFTRDVADLEPADRLTDEQLHEALELIEAALIERGVQVDLVREVPERLVYQYLYAELRASEFDYYSPGTTCHLTACGGYCPECFQRPWCDMGSSSCWPEDEEAGEMAIPAAARRFVSASPVSLEVLRAEDTRNGVAW